jgi:hypothetical protein
VLEEAGSLSDWNAWLPSGETITLDGNLYSMVLGFGSATRFYRLQDVGALLTTFSSSPANGESGVATTRETILHFNQPLAADTLLTSTNLYAEFAGRRILSRIELSSDRRKATLFYLENLPASARIRVTFDAQDVRDIFGRLVDADGDRVEGGVTTIQFDTLSVTPVAATAIIGHVFASQLAPNPTNAAQSVNVPLAGVTVTVDGAEETLRTTTDANGFFRLEACPAGRFFVHVDGRTSPVSDWPSGAYYPFVGKAWEAKAGQTNNLASGSGEIFLPLIKAGTLQPVSATEDTTITLPPDVIAANPALEGVSIVVPANSLFSDNGARGGKVGIAPVPPDRLPEPLPPGLNFPLVITIQSDGPANFDRPVPVRFPNLPDPVTGQALPPGAKSALISFNHDLGHWEIAGPMTVGMDGRFVVTDPGVGVRQPGWHGTAPNSRPWGFLSPSYFQFSSRSFTTRGFASSSDSGNGPGITANTPFTLSYYDPRLRACGSASFISAGPGAFTTLPNVSLSAIGLLDSDLDGLPDCAEGIIGTNPTQFDTDGDGVSDGAEVEQGTNPLDGRPARTGVIAAVDTSGTALDVAALNNVAVVADGGNGVVVFDASNPFQPIQAAVIPTRAPAQAVALSARYAVVAQGNEGIAVIDVSNPSKSAKLYDLRFGGVVRAVAVRGNTAFVGVTRAQLGLFFGEVVLVDIPTGHKLEGVMLFDVFDGVDDLGVRGGHLFVATAKSLYSYRLGEPLTLVGSASLGFVANGITQRRRLFVGTESAFVTSYPGYDVIDVRNPAALARIGNAAEFGPNSFKQIVDNGSGLGVAAVGVNPIADGTHDVYLFDVGNPAVTTSLLTVLPTPGIAYAVSIFNGLAYVADGSAGLQVINYRAYDNAGQPPTVALQAGVSMTSATEGRFESGQEFIVTANVSDDVQVRNVEFYMDGERVVTDGNYPFEQVFIAPALTDGKPSFTLRARAIDTGGNATLTPEILVTVVADNTPPEIASRFPRPTKYYGAVDTLLVRFNEPLKEDTIAAGVKVMAAGSDRFLGTADDVTVIPSGISYRRDENTVVASFGSGLPAGIYAARVAPPLADAAGNFSPEVSWSFAVLGREDGDQDGVPDLIELALGFDPANPDSDGDGILDGNEDIDGDDLPTALEIALGYDPARPDSDDNLVEDGQEDRDGDGLKNAVELALGTNLQNPDTDGDGWNDEAEITSGSDPLQASSRPRFSISARPPVRVIVPGTGSTDSLPLNTFVAQPGVRLTIPAVGSTEGLPLNTRIATPPVRVEWLSP